MIRNNQGFSIIEALLLVVICGLTALAASSLNGFAADSIRQETIEMELDQEIKRADILFSDTGYCTSALADLQIADENAVITLPLKLTTADLSGLEESQISIVNKMQEASSLFSSSASQKFHLTNLTLSSSVESPHLRYLKFTFTETTQNKSKNFVRTLPLHINFSAGGQLLTCSTLPLISTTLQTCPNTPAVSHCESGRPRHIVSQTFKFDSVMGCAWGQNGNLSRSTGALARARSEHYYSLNLPSGAEVCSVHFNFHTGKVVYDDEFYFTFNGVVLASSAGPSVPRYLPLSAGQYLWDWSKIAGQRGVVVEGGSRTSYCAPAPEAQEKIAPLEQEALSASTARKKEIQKIIQQLQSQYGNHCKWPATQRTGTIDMKLSPRTFTQIFKANPSNNQGFGMITLGNAHSYDCAQSGISFEAQIEYAEP